MAARSGSVGGMLYSLIIFVFLFVICLVLTILFYSRANEQSQLAAEANEAVKAMRSPVEADSDSYKALLNSARQNDRSLFGQMTVQQSQVHRLITGVGEDTVGQVKEKLAGIGVKGGQSTVVGAITDTRATAAAAEEARAKAEAASKATADELAQVKLRYDSLIAAHKTELDNRQGQIDQFQARLNDYEQSSDAERQQVVDQLTQTRQKSVADLQVKETEIRNLNATIAQKDVRLRELVAALRELMPESPDPTLEPDGKIIGVTTEGRTVYIDLGSQDNVILGMNFEVFDAATGPQLEEVRPGEIATRQKRGKATAEVIRIDENTATCRVIRQERGQRLSAGDVVSNLAYDKKRVYKFFIYGDFDLDFDEQTDPGDFDLIVSMVRQWGGKVYEGDEMPLDTDFLVLGREPELPAAGGDTFDPQVLGDIERKRAAWEKYQRIGAQASELSVPVLNQNRFMTLMGYFRR